MREWIRVYRKAAVLVGITLAVPLLVLLLWVGDLWAVRQEYQGEIDRLAPRIARLRGLLGSEEALQASAEQLGSRMENLVYPPTEDHATLSAALQNDVREIVTEAGLTVSNSQVLPAEQEDGFEHVAVKLTVSGDIGALDEALAELTGREPMLLVRSLEVWPDRRSRRRRRSEPEAPQPQTLSARMELVSLRLGE